jgi:hypothetical protein
MMIFESINIRDEVGTVLDPFEGDTQSVTTSSRTIASRPSTLDGQTLALIDNRAGPRFREILLQRLQAMFDFREVIHVVKDTVNVPPRPEDWEEVVKRGTVGLALYGA